MSAGDGSIDLRALSAQDRRWYADLRAKARGDRTGPANAHKAGQRKLRYQKNSCVRLKGNRVKRHTDTRGVLWSDDLAGRWFCRGAKGALRLQRVLGELRYGRPPADDELVCHICGWCDCILLEHILYQSKQADTEDKRHHKRFGRGTIRPALLTLLPG